MYIVYIELTIVRRLLLLWIRQMTMGDDGNLEMLASDVELTCGTFLPATLVIIHCPLIH